MKIEHKALTFAVTMAVLVPACYITTEKPADSAPPAVPSATAPAAATNPPLVTATASTPPTATAVPTTPPTQPRPPGLPAAKPLPSTSAAVAPSASVKP
jgi:hypothetical protein